MNTRSEEEGLRTRLEKIELDLATYKILLHFQAPQEPLVLHFDRPSRRFYFALIALIITEMKNLGKPGFIHIRKHEKILRLLDHSLAGQHASKTADGMWGKISKAWQYRLPDLEGTIHFKILDRDRIRPYEKGGKYRYECSEEESDTWANLFVYDENNPWRFKFAMDSASLDLEDISLIFGDLRDNAAWQGFVKGLSKELPVEPEPVSEKRRTMPTWRRRAAFASVIVLVVGAAVVAIWNSYLRPPRVEPASVEKMAYPLPDEPSIAVLPFTNMSGDPEQDYLVDGITENIITALSRVPNLFVISRNSTFTYKGTPVRAQQVSEDLGVRYILEGSVQSSGEELRITAQLIDAIKGRHLWADRYDRGLKDIFVLQDEITLKIIKELQVKLTMGESAMVRAESTDNIQAYLKCLQGIQYFIQMNPDDNTRARQMFEEAIALDPRFAEAYAHLAGVHMIDAKCGWGKSRNKSLDEANKLLQKALEMDESNPVVLTSLAALLTRFGEWDRAIAAARRAVSLAPNDTTCIDRLGAALEQSAMCEEAIPHLKRALRLNPLFPVFTLALLGGCHMWMEQYEEAIPFLERVLQITPRRVPALMHLAACYAGLGRQDEAQATIEKVLTLSPRLTVEKYIKGFPHKDHADQERLADLLRKAGMPD